MVFSVKFTTRRILEFTVNIQKGKTIISWERAAMGEERGARGGGGLNINIEVVVAKILFRLLDSSQIVFIRDSGYPATA